MGKKCYSKMYMRLDLERGAFVQVHISEDGRPFRKVWGTHDADRPIMTAFILPTRCDSFKVKITGKGRVILKAFVREFDTGSEV